MPERDQQRLNGWKDIATYLRVSQRTAQAYEKDFQLPVRRLEGQDKSRVWAYASDLDEWRIRRELEPAREPEPPAAPTETRRPRRWVIPAVAALVCTLSVAAAVYWYRRSIQQPAGFTIEGRLLTVFDERNQKLWDYVFPQGYPTAKVDKRSKVADIDDDGRNEVLFVWSGQVYCFRHDGRLAWTHRAGRALTTNQGKAVRRDYQANLLDVLSKTRSNGGRIVIGSYEGPTSLYVVELMTKDGRQVGEYFHFGWFFHLLTGFFGKDGTESIFLGGVDDITGNSSEYGATLVVLDPDRVSGQPSDMANDPRGVKDIPPAREKAVLLIKEFERNSDPHLYCAGYDVQIKEDQLEVKIAQGELGPAAHFFFDRQLRLVNVTPELQLLEVLRSTILRNVPPARWQEVEMSSLGDIVYRRNEFAEK